MEIEQKERERIEEWAEIHFGKYGVQAVATAITSKQDEHLHLQKEVIQPLMEFKKYVHKRLDDAGVSVDPESPHKAAGCRIGGRLDEVFSTISKLEAEIKALREQAKKDFDRINELEDRLEQLGEFEEE